MQDFVHQQYETTTTLESFVELFVDGPRLALPSAPKTLNPRP